MYFTSSTSGACATCTSAYSCDGTSRSACPTGTTTNQVGQDGKCYACPTGFVCSSSAITGASAVAAGSYSVNIKTSAACSTDEMCVNGVKTTCSGTTWAISSYTGCNYCIPNHYCNGLPVSCSNGYYLPTLDSATNTCTACSAGYICKKDWYGQVKVYPGTYSGVTQSGSSECPEGNSCSASSSSISTCNSNTYSSRGDYVCNSAPTWLKFASTGNRSHVTMAAFSLGSKQQTNDASQIGCGTTNYCPGDGSSYTEYSGLNINGASVVPKPPGDSCSNGDSSNGGIECSDCSENSSDRSNCQNPGANSYRKTQFARGFVNTDTDRELDSIACLWTGKIDGTDATETGQDGRECGIEGTFDQTDESGSTLTGGI